MVISASLNPPPWKKRISEDSPDELKMKMLCNRCSESECGMKTVTRNGRKTNKHTCTPTNHALVVIVAIQDHALATSWTRIYIYIYISTQQEVEKHKIKKYNPSLKMKNKCLDDSHSKSENTTLFYPSTMVILKLGQGHQNRYEPERNAGNTSVLSYLLGVKGFML